MTSGIYQIINLISARRYIGSSQNIESRKKSHFCQLKGDRHPNRFLQKSFNKHGIEAFEFSVILLCDPENCIFYENLAIQCISPQFNLAPVAGSNRGVKYSEESRAKMSAHMKGNKRGVGRSTSDLQREIMRNNKYGLGKARPDQVKALMSDFMRGNSYARGYRHTEEWKAEQSIRVKAIWAKRKAQVAIT